MSGRVLLTFILLSAITLALAYRPILARLSVGLVSPYAKADVTKRLFAAAVDGMLVATALVPYLNSESLVCLLAGAGYLLLRDAVRGRSVGKFVCGLMVINLETGRPCGCGPSVNRNLIFLLPGANVAAAFLEAGTILRDPQGQRLGDRFALTQVVEGFGARDVVAAVQEWWLAFIFHLDRISRGSKTGSGAGTISNSTSYLNTQEG
ncbi:MAG TPA: RDD family protein [Terriglobia bacterium]|nr:RDD family protein [Terriglobia bacterium]